MEDMQNESRGKKAVAAILSTFPTVECLMSIYQNKNNTPIGNSFIDFAVRNGVIPSPDAESLEQFIRTHTDNMFKFRLTGDISFEDLLNNKEETLNLNLSLRALCARVNTLLTDTQDCVAAGDSFHAHAIKKRAPGYGIQDERPSEHCILAGGTSGQKSPGSGISRRWSSCFPKAAPLRKTATITKAVRIGFALTSRGEVIDHEIIGWLKKTIKSYISEALGHFLYGKWGQGQGLRH